MCCVISQLIGKAHLSLVSKTFAKKKKKNKVPSSFSQLSVLYLPCLRINILFFFFFGMTNDTSRLSRLSGPIPSAKEYMDNFKSLCLASVANSSHVNFEDNLLLKLNRRPPLVRPSSVHIALRFCFSWSVTSVVSFFVSDRLLVCECLS